MSKEESTELEIERTEASTVSQSVETRCDLKCTHHGDRVCYNDNPSKDIIKKMPEESTDSSSTVSVDMDSLHSGESLFKTFSFQGQQNDPDMEKCVTFWRSILAKNAKPIKCTLVKTKENKEKVLKKETVEKEPCDRQETKDMWLSVYKDLQRRKLDKLKLVKSKKCEPCEYFTDDDYEKKQEVENIKNLNEWQPHTHPSKFDIQSQVKRTLEVLKAAKSFSGEDNKHSKKTSKRESELVKIKSASEFSKEIKSTSALSTEAKSASQLPTVTKSASKIPTEVKSASDLKDTKTNSAQDLSEGINVKFDKTEKEHVAKPVIHQTAELTQSRDKPATEEIKIITDVTQENITKREEIKTCCNCGCDVEDCVCVEMGDYLGPSPKETKKSEGCFPCDCSGDCVCEDHEPSHGKACVCGCRVEECTCENLRICTCGCGVDDCMCRGLEEKSGCACGCGVEDCMCQQLFTESCKCGHAECDCDMIKTLNAYLENLNASGGIQFRGKRVSNEESQTEDKEAQAAAAARPARYCMICGHFNCHCCETE